MSEPRNQHWLPQFYLRRFAEPGYRDKKKAKIWLMDTETGEVRRKKISAVAAAEYLYSHVKTDGTRCFRVDKDLTELETLIARLYPRIAEGYPDLSAAWGIKKLSALFIISLVLRHPGMEEETQEMHRKMVDLYERMPKDSKGRPMVSHIFEDGKAFELDTSHYDEYKAADENRLKQMFAEQIRPLAMNLTDELFKKRWTFLCTDEPVFFTSDNPVIKQHDELRTFGVRTPGMHLWFPVSPTRMLWMSDRIGDQPDGFYPLPVSEAHALNMFTMANASRFLLSHEQPDRRLRELDGFVDQAIREYKPTRPLDGPIW